MASTGTTIHTSPAGSAAAAAVKAGNAGLGRAMARGGLEWVKFDLGFGKMAPRGMGRLLGPAGTLYFGTYQGYKKGGARGALAGTAEHLKDSFLFGAVMKGIGRVFGPTAKVIGGGAAAAGAGLFAGAAINYAMTGASGLATASPWQFLAGPMVADHMKRHSELELGRPIVDQFGTLATMRQRSLAAIQNSKINGRSAVGNEATLMYQPYFR